MEHIEKQRLNLWWLYLIIGMESIIILSVILFDKGGMTIHHLKSNYFAPIIALLIPWAIIYAVNRSNIVLQINENGIAYQFRPLGKRKSLTWDEIASAQLRKYDALGEYGGWGVKSRLWFKFNDKAYIFNDLNIGLQLELKNGKKILFSTAKADELALFLINLKSKYNLGAIVTHV